MSGEGGETPPLVTGNGGEYLLSLLQRPAHQSRTLSQHPPEEHQSSLALDPAVAAVGPTLPFTPPTTPLLQQQPWLNGGDLTPLSPWPHTLSPSPQNYFNFSPGTLLPRTPITGNYLPENQFPVSFGDDLRRLGILGNDSVVHNIVHQKQQQQKLMFGSIPSEIRSCETSPNGSLMGFSKEREEGFANRKYGGLDRNRNISLQGNSNSNALSHGNFDQQRWGKQHHGGNVNSTTSSDRRPPPGFPSKARGDFKRDSGNRRGFRQNVYKDKGYKSELSYGKPSFSGHSERSGESELSRQLNEPGPPAGSNLHSVLASDVDNSLSESNRETGEDRYREGERRKEGDRYLDELGEEMVDSLLLDSESDGKNHKKQLHTSREKDARSDPRGQRLLSQKIRNLKSQMRCRIDVERLNAQFLGIYESLIPAEEERAKQKQLLLSLEKIIYKEWPHARVFLYGSCANQFGVSRSDIDVCLAFKNTDIDKAEVLLKLADLLQSDNLQNVQALTRARVPIVKLMDPTTGISCDICINNVLAVVNTKLLRDYAQIDIRLRQLAFIVKHWAKSRGVNETYQGTLSSYAYVLMCIHFLQQRRPAILPCLQRMETTYCETVDDIECSYFDRVDKLPKSENKETIAQLVWAFFHYWAYCHDYANSVISVRTGNIISKQEKDWTRRIGNDRHLICIEDPFETSHDLGRVVDKYSIRVLREEFERAAYIMQYDPNPCVALFEPYVTR